MIIAVIFDFFGVLEADGRPNEQLLSYIKSDLQPYYKLGIISNTDSDSVHEILSKTDADMFDEIIMSYQVGLMKPDPLIYELALKRLGVEPSEAIFIDDIERFCQAARGAGMQAVNYSNFELTKAGIEALFSAQYE